MIYENYCTPKMHIAFVIALDADFINNLDGRRDVPTYDDWGLPL